MVGWCSMGTFNDPIFDIRIANHRTRPGDLNEKQRAALGRVLLRFSVLRPKATPKMRSFGSYIWILWLLEYYQPKIIPIIIDYLLEYCMIVLEYGFVWKCWVNIPNEIAIFHRDNDQQNHWVQWGLAYFQTHPFNKKCFWHFLSVLLCFTEPCALQQNPPKTWKSDVLRAPFSVPLCCVHNISQCQGNYSRFKQPIVAIQSADSAQVGQYIIRKTFFIVVSQHLQQILQELRAFHWAPNKNSIKT